MSSRFEQFLREREYLLGVTPNTIEWHRQSLQWLRIEEPTAEDLKELVLRMRAAGLKPSSVNCRLRSINAYLHWNSGASTDRKCGAGCQHPHVPRVKEPVLVLPTFSLEDIHKLRAYKPKDYCQQRLQTLALRSARPSLSCAPSRTCCSSDATRIRWTRARACARIRRWF